MSCNTVEQQDLAIEEAVGQDDFLIVLQFFSYVPDNRPSIHCGLPFYHRYAGLPVERSSIVAALCHLQIFSNLHLLMPEAAFISQDSRWVLVLLRQYIYIYIH